MQTSQPLAGASATSGSGSSGWRRDIQGLRAIAVILVVAFHAGLPVPGGFIGVDVFFVISGFVITAMLRREWSQTGRIRFGRFYARRFKRLTPALALMVCVAMAASVVVLSPFGPQQTAARTGVGAMLFSANFVIANTTGGYFDGPATLNPLLNTWSLSVEEQFYLAFPAILIAGWQLSRRGGLARSAPLMLAGIIAFASFGLALSGSFSPEAPTVWLGFYSPFTRAWEFAAGALLALVLESHAVRAARVCSALGIAGFSIVIAATWLINESTPFPGLWTLLPVAGTILLLIAGECHRAPTTRLLSTGPAVKIGDWSYSIYLWHWPFVVFAAMLLPDRPIALIFATMLSTVPALASFRWVEQPLRTSARGGRRFMTALVSATLLPALAMSVLLGLGARLSWGDSTIRTAARAQSNAVHLGWTDCMVLGPGSNSCTFNTTGKHPPIYLVGDSNAAMYAEAALEAAEALDSPLHIQTAAGCPFADVYVESAGRDDFSTLCRSDYESTLAYLRHMPPGTVVIGESTRYVTEDFMLGSSPTSMTSSNSDRVAALERGLINSVEMLRKFGHTVVLVAPTYRLTEPGPSLDQSRCNVWELRSGNCAAPVPVAETSEAQEWLREAVARVADEARTVLLDPTAQQCPERSCGLFSNGLPVYTDVDHLSVELSHALAPEMTEAIRSAR